MKYSVTTKAGVVYDAETMADAEAVVEAIVSGNRWAMDGQRRNITIEPKSGEPDPTPLRDKVFTWNCHIESGFAGWSAEPLIGKYDEEVLARGRESKTVIVYAPSALDAIAKAQLLLFC